jgi:hypothetical protein
MRTGSGSPTSGAAPSSYLTTEHLTKQGWLAGHRLIRDEPVLGSGSRAKARGLPSMTGGDAGNRSGAAIPRTIQEGGP